MTAAATILPLLMPESWRRQRMLFALSGGCDSVALLHTLHEAGASRLIVCHYNHRLRGRASGQDARFAAALAKRLGYEYENDAGDVSAMARLARQPLEVAAREARYRFFAQVARRRRCSSLILAHHADDQVETLLLNLFRGGALAGLSGMAAESKRTINGTPLRLLRPFLPLWKRDIQAAALTHGWKWREDASNATPEFTRNRIRHELLPLTEAIFGRDTRATLWRTAEILRSEEALLRSLHPAEESPALSVPELRAAPLALQRRRLLQWLRDCRVPNIGFREVERVRELLDPTTRIAKVNLPGAHHARRREKQLFIERPSADKA